MATNPDSWSRAYARQALADLDTWNKLQAINDVPRCHQLLFLQMACEKLCKAHLCAAGSDPRDLQTSHAYIAKHLPRIVGEQIARLKPKNGAWVLQRSRHLAHEIELLAPAVRRGGHRLDNCEYPWEDASGQLQVPLDWSFTPTQLLTESTGRTFLKLVGEAIRQLLK